jgi:ribose transport system permease protein
MTTEPVGERPSLRVGLARLVPRGLPDELGVLAALVLLAVVIGILRPTFFQPYNLLTLVRSSSFFGIMALGMVFLLALGDIDLSVGSNFNFVAVMTATAMVAGVTPWLAAMLGIVFGTLLGVANGILAVGLRVPVIIVTLGTLSMFRGLALVVSGSKGVIPPQVTSSFFTLANSKLLGFIPVVAVVFVVLAVVLHFVLHRTRFGYRVQAIGSNPEAARLVGIPISRTRIQVLALMGAACGIAGVVTLGFFGSADPALGTGYELLVISAAIIGGTPLSGGSGTVFGALIGVLIIAVITSGLVQLGVQDTWSIFATGGVIVLAVALDRLVKRRQAMRALSRRRPV